MSEGLKKPGYLILTPLPSVIWRLRDSFGIPLGRFAPMVFGLMIGSMHHNVEPKPDLARKGIAVKGLVKALLAPKVLNTKTPAL